MRRTVLLALLFLLCWRQQAWSGCTGIGCCGIAHECCIPSEQFKSATPPPGERKLLTVTTGQLNAGDVGYLAVGFDDGFIRLCDSIPPEGCQVAQVESENSSPAPRALSVTLELGENMVDFYWVEAVVWRSTGAEELTFPFNCDFHFSSPAATFQDSGLRIKEGIDTVRIAAYDLSGGSPRPAGVPALKLKQGTDTYELVLLPAGFTDPQASKMKIQVNGSEWRLRKCAGAPGACD